MFRTCAVAAFMMVLSASAIAPADDAEAGAQIFLQLLNDEQMNYYRVKDGKPGEAELWQRCKLTS